MRRLFTILALSVFTSTAQAEEFAEDAFGAVRGPPRRGGRTPLAAMRKDASPVALGCRWMGRAGAAMRLSRERNWAHPALAAFVVRLSERVPEVGLQGLLVGDMGQPRGGPMKSGHRSHQIGLDVDVWLRPLTVRPDAVARESLSSYDLVKGRYKLDGDLWSKSAWRAIRLAAEDGAVARIFVNAAIKRKLCQVTPVENRGWLRKVRPWWGHDSHFHVRLACPAGVPGCKNQQPPPAGDGCGKELDWWFTDGPYSGTSKPKPKLTLDDLPEQCRAVLAVK